jgi:threonine/homoserine/homoserine lactone efflux protein
MAFLTIFFSSFLIALSGAMMPGPLLTATIGEASRRGFHAGPLLIVGHGILELVMVAGLLLGLAPYLQQQEIFIAIALSGAMILLWMAFSIFRSLPTLVFSDQVGAPQHGNLVFAGIIMSAVNPYWAIWWATIGFGYILHSQRFGIAGIGFFFAGHILADLFWYSAVSGAVARGRRFLSDRLYRGIMGACAIILIFFAGYFFGSRLAEAL